MPPEKSPQKPTKAQRHAAIDALWGILRPKPGEPSWAEYMAAHKAEERALEQRREDFLMNPGRGKSDNAAGAVAPPRPRRVRRNSPGACPGQK